MRKFIAVAAAVAALASPAAQAWDQNQALGTIIGGIAGSQFGKGDGQIAATIGGAVIGGIVGDRGSRYGYGYAPAYGVPAYPAPAPTYGYGYAPSYTYRPMYRAVDVFVPECNCYRTVMVQVN